MSEQDKAPIPGVRGKMNEGLEITDPVIDDVDAFSKNFYNDMLYTKERPISSVYPVIDTDLARDNIENDLSSADLQDL